MFPPPSSHLSAFDLFSAAPRALQSPPSLSVCVLILLAFWSRGQLSLVRSLGSAPADPDQVECHERVVLAAQYLLQGVLWQLLELPLYRFDILFPAAVTIFPPFQRLRKADFIATPVSSLEITEVPFYVLQ